jgi:hypothetical protein
MRASSILELRFGDIDLPVCAELRKRLHDVHRRQPPAIPGLVPIRIGVEDPDGDLAHVIETTRLMEAVRVFETMTDLGLVPGRGRCRASDGRVLVCTYRQRRPEAVRT